MAAQASAGFLNGNDLYEDCQNKSPAVTGYVMGVIDLTDWKTVATAVGGTHVQLEPAICLEDKVLAKQVRDLVCKHLEDNPGTRHYPGPYHVYQAVVPAFPCTSGQ